MQEVMSQKPAAPVGPRGAVFLIAKSVVIGIVVGIALYYSEYAAGQFMLGWTSVK